MTQEYYKKYRPTTLKEVVGQSKVVKQLESFLKAGTLPHCIMLAGPVSGIGKTTLARIIRDRLECSENDFYEMNTADFRGIDTVRDIRSSINLSPMFGKCRIWLFDECHAWSGPAQESLLKLLEDTPRHAYFILCTTEPQKLKPTILTRCYRFDLQPIDKEDMTTLLESVMTKEEIELSESVLDKLIEVAKGSARRALVLLEQVAKLEDEDEQLESILKGNPEQTAYDLVKALLYSQGKWIEVKSVLDRLSKEEEPESLRRYILSVASTELMKGKGTAARANLIINAFESNFYDGGMASLRSRCWECCMSKG